MTKCHANLYLTFKGQAISAVLEYVTVIKRYPENRTLSNYSATKITNATLPAVYMYISDTDNYITESSDRLLWQQTHDGFREIRGNKKNNDFFSISTMLYRQNGWHLHWQSRYSPSGNTVYFTAVCWRGEGVTVLLWLTTRNSDEAAQTNSVQVWWPWISIQGHLCIINIQNIVKWLLKILVWKESIYTCIDICYVFTSHKKNVFQNVSVWSVFIIIWKRTWANFYL